MKLAERILAWELVWPLPLLVIGILGLQVPLLVILSLVLACMPWLARWIVTGRITRPSFLGNALGLLAISAGIGVWAAYDRALSWPMLLTLLGSLSLFFAIINSDAPTRHIAGGLAVAAGLLALYFVGQYAHFGYGEAVGRRPGYLGGLTGSLLPRLVLFTPDPNAMAGFLEGALLASLALAWSARGRGRWAWGCAAALIGYALLITGSRGAWVGVAVALAMGALLLIPSRALRLALGALGIAGAVAAVSFAGRLAASGQQLVFFSSALDTAGNRLALYLNSLHLLADYPLTGIGLGDTFAMVYSRYQLLILVPFLTYSHNLFLSVALGQGVLGLLALAWLLIGFYVFAARVELAGVRQPSLFLFRAAWLGATATFVHGLIDSPQFSASRWTMPMLFALLGLAIRIGLPATARLEWGVGRRGWRWIGPAAVALTLIVAGLVFRQQLAGAWQANLGALYQTQAELAPDLDDIGRETAMAQAVAHFERTLVISPAHPAANRRLGLIALGRQDFETAAAYLERAYPLERSNQATLKALGYAYLWTGRLDPARELFRQVQLRSELVKELDYWRWWWGEQGQPDLARYAEEMKERLEH